ncbi:MAG: hypothetical protein D3910_01345 [Candidatus Electrothrix sp. ATG2]|nr:hypothetical protein [Candidatus Electrothrix sp. ATG2]
MTLEKSVLSSKDQKKWLWTLFLYLAVDLARIQDLLPVLKFVRPGMLSTLLLMFWLRRSQQVGYPYSFPQIKKTVLFICLLFAYVPCADGASAAFGTGKLMFLFLPSIFSTVILINSKERLVQLLRVYGVIVFLVCRHALQNGGRGPGGTILDENDLALFIVSFTPFLFVLFQCESKKLFKIFWLAAVVFALATVVASFSRGGFIGLVVMGSVYWLFSKKKVIVTLCVICLGGGGYFLAGDDYKKDMGTVTDTKESTANERLLSWEAATYMFLDHPLGVGGNNFRRLFNKYQPPEMHKDMWGRQAHSLWFTLIPETGLIGIMLYFSIIISNLKGILKIYRTKERLPGSEDSFFKTISVAILSSLLAFFAAGSFISVLYYPIFWYLTALIVTVQIIHSSLTSVSRVTSLP